MKFQICGRILGERIIDPLWSILKVLNRTGTKPSLSGPLRFAFCVISTGKIPSCVVVNYPKPLVSGCKWSQGVLYLISGSLSDVLRINPKWKQKFGSSVIYRHFCRYLPNFCHWNCSDNIVFRRGYHLCFVVRFLCDGMIYFSWGLINGFSSKVAFTINNEMPRKKFFCFDLGWHIIRCCPSFSDWNKVCIDDVHLQNWIIQRFFFVHPC